jgi:hypothetical protein
MANDQTSSFLGSVPDENLYAAPKAEALDLSAEDFVGGRPAAIRRDSYRREKTIKRIAWINLVLAIVWFPAAIGSLFVLTLLSLRRAGIDIAPSIRLPASMPTGIELVAATVLHFSVFSFFVAGFYGLRTLKSWARWAMVGLALIVLFAGPSVAYFGGSALSVSTVVIGAGSCFLVGTVVYVLVSPPSGKVFTREYRDAVARTRGMRF